MNTFSKILFVEDENVARHLHRHKNIFHKKYFHAVDSGDQFIFEMDLVLLDHRRGVVDDDVGVEVDRRGLPLKPNPTK